jgi:hypothetical protein
MKKSILVFITIICLLIFTSCAAGINPSKDTMNDKGENASFLQGLWHGVITPVTFVISLFSPDVNVYEVHNNGGWYNFGFVLGLSIIFGGSAGTAGRRRRRY